MNVNIAYVNLNDIRKNVNIGSTQAIKDELAAMTIAEFSGYLHDIGTFATNVSGDTSINLIKLPPGEYVFIAYDDSIPGGMGIISAAPVIVVDYTLTLTTMNLTNPGEDIRQGGTVLAHACVTSAADPGNYMYAVFAVPEADYSGTMGITFNEDEELLNVTLKAMSIDFTGNINEIYSKARSNLTWLKEFAEDTFKGTNVSFSEYSGTSHEADISLKLPENAMVGKYIIVAAVYDKDLQRLIALKSSTFEVKPDYLDYTVNLKEGWNLVSIPVDIEPTPIEDLFPADTLSKMAVIWVYDSSDPSDPWEYYTTMTDEYEQGYLTTLDEKLGFWVYAMEDISFTVSGQIPDSSEVPLNSGWNLVGNPALVNRNVWDVYGDSLIVWEYDNFNPTVKWSYYTTMTDEYEQGDLTALRPGYGYWVYIL
jgi:methanogen extracellular protein (TIGR04279 family)